MKYGIFGNTNNYSLNFALALKSSGHEVLLIVTEKTLLHRPESIYPEFKAGYPDWIIDYSHLSEWDIINLHPDLSKILAELSTCDGLILNAHGPSLLLFLNKPALALLTGSDLTDYADFNSVEKRLQGNSDYIKSLDGIKSRTILQDFISRQRLGISLSRWVSYLPEGLLPEDDRLLESITNGSVKRGFLILSNVDKLAFTPLRHNDPIQIFCGARLTWKLPSNKEYSSLDYKGGDNLIKGIGLFIRETGIPLDVHLVRKGHHVKETEVLIEQENLTNYVRWSNEMSHSDYFDAIRQSDIVIDNLGPAVPGLVTLDALAIGRPVIVNSRNYFKDKIGNAPIYEASSPKEVCDQLKKLVLSSSEREMAAHNSRQFMEINYSNQSVVNTIQSIFGAANNSNDLNNEKLKTAFNYLLEYQHISIQEAELKYNNQKHALQISELGNSFLKREQELLALFGKWIRSKRNFISRSTSKHDQINLLRLKKPFIKLSGLCWQSPLPSLMEFSDNIANNRRSSILLFENDQPLLPAHSVHDDICVLGSGRYSHWEGELLFSTSDGTDPNTNDREYSIVY